MAYENEVIEQSHIAAAKLIEVLQAIPPDSLVWVTRVFELGISNSSGEQLGYVALGAEKFEPF